MAQLWHVAHIGKLQWDPFQYWNIGILEYYIAVYDGLFLGNKPESSQSVFGFIVTIRVKLVFVPDCYFPTRVCLLLVPLLLAPL